MGTLGGVGLICVQERMPLGSLEQEEVEWFALQRRMGKD